MQIESINGLSRKSRGILYHLKNSLNQQKLTLQDHINNLFGFMKTSFHRKEFSFLIKAFDDKLVLSEVDQLFIQLDESCNQIVFYEYLKKAYEDINQDDNPKKPNEQVLERAASKRTSRWKIKQLIHIFKEIRAVFMQSEDIIEIIHLFALENQGYLTQNNLIDIFNNIGYSNEHNKKTFLAHMFEQKGKVSVDELLEKLDLDQSARRQSIQSTEKLKISIQNSQDMNQSQFIKSQIRQRHSTEEEEVLIKGGIASDGTDYIPIEKIPEAVRQYFNYGSELEPVFAHFAEEQLKNSLIFIDPENPPYSAAFQWVHLAERYGTYHLFQMAKSVIDRKHRTGLAQLLQPKDIKQGSLGDCYFLSALAGVVEKYPELVYRLFVLEKNPSHLFGVRLFIEGSWRTVVLDACFPVTRHGMFCGAQPHHQEIWVMLLQKAWAKVYGSYDNIHAGYNEEGLNAVSGAPCIMVSSQENEFLRRVEVQLRRGSIITCATSDQVRKMDKHQQQHMGIFQNHAYSLLNIYSNIKTINGDVTLLKVRNPWGRKQWQGDWSYNSPYWTSDLRKKLDYERNPHDGSFFINNQDFKIFFDHIHICRVNLANKNSWIEIQNERDEFKTVKLIVKEKGDYYFTIYQENPRRYSGRPYEKSKSWIFLMREEKGKRTAIGSSCKQRRDNTMEATLEPGQYILMAKVQWKLWPKHHFTISSYGPERVIFERVDQWNIHNLSDFIDSKAKLGFGKKSFYDNNNILKRVLFSVEEGYGFVLVNNQEHIIFRLTIQFDNHRGLTILPPYSLPLTLEVFPGEEVICKFLVDPTGYSYSFRESYKYAPIM